MTSSCPVIATLSLTQYLTGADPLLTDEQLPAQLRHAGSPQADNVLELTRELGVFCDQEFSPALLQRGLLLLMPRVVLLAMPAGATVPARVDYPFLSEPDLEALLTWCEAQQYPNRPSLLEELLSAVAR